MKMERKKLVVYILIVLFVVLGVVNILNAMMYIYFVPDLKVLKVARTVNPVTMDPCDSWDNVSNNMLDQVVETLIAYNLSDPTFPLIGRLAESWYWSDNVSLTFKLRENVFFHDGSKFTADCVLHSIERINFFGNATGTLTDPHHMAAPHSLYKFADGTPIFNETLSFITADLNVTLVLNRPFGPVEGLLTYTASSIVHPDSTPVNEMLVLGEDLVVGTGPFKLVSYVPNWEVKFKRWDRYWDEPAYWNEIVYVYYEDAVNVNTAMLVGDIDYLGQGIAALKEIFENSSNITVTGDGVHDSINGSTYNYVLFKSEWINHTWRKAICHAFNYSYLIHNLLEDTIVRAHSLVPPGFPAYNSSMLGGTYNIPYARQLMQSMGYGYTGGVPWDIGSQIGDVFIPGADENLWKAAEFIPNVGNFSDNLWNFYHRPGSYFLESLIQQFEHDMDLIGIKVGPCFYSWGEWPIPQDFWERIHLCWLSRYPDYFETFNRIDSLINPESSLDIHKIDNAEINALLATTIAETDTFKRYEYYEKLQYLIHDKYYYHMPLFYDKLYYVHAASLKGFPYNCMRNLYWYPTYRE